MDWIRTTAESYRRLGMINGATSDDDDKLTPASQLDQICQLLRTSSHGETTVVVKEVSQLVLKRLDHNSPIVKHKVLRLIKYVVGKPGGEEFKREIQRNSAVVRQLFHYKGHPHPLKGDALNKAVRDSAREAISAIFSSADNKQAAKTPSPDFTHFISLPLATNPELVDKLMKFQNSILGSDDLNKVNTTNKRPISNPSKASSSSEPQGVRPSSLSDLGIEKSVFTNPRTFHLTVLMLKLWNEERVAAAVEVLKSASLKVLNALEGRPVSISLKGLDCMRGVPAEAWVVHIPVKEIGSEARLLRACHAIIDAFVEAGLAEKDAKQRLKLHATVMNAKYRKRGEKTRKTDSIDARGIFQKFGSMEWGKYRIREAHLSQRFAYDRNGYFRRCASIPFQTN